MPTPAIFKQVFTSSRMLTKKELKKLTLRLDTAFNCVDHFESLEETRGYENGKQFPAELYQRGIQKRLLDNWLCSKPTIYTLSTKSHNIESPGSAGCEWAAYLRVRSPGAVVLRVYPKDRTVSPDMILCQIVSSLIFNFATLVPEEFDRVPDLCKQSFDALVQGGQLGIEAGLRILEALPPFVPCEKGLLCIVDALNLAQDGSTDHEAKRLAVILERIMARNKGHLLYTVAKRI
ncbi:hypothetical protein GGS21DRAFT_541741 [Xylaria nigripes]|nr:hypothetical protein GGS21DRAFT_541741 [Xylaria nigripes]